MNVNFDMMRLNNVPPEKAVPLLVAHINRISKKLNDMKVSDSLEAVAQSVTIINKISSGSGGSSSGLSASFQVERKTNYPLVAGDNPVPFDNPFDDLDYVLLPDVYKLVPEDTNYKYKVAFSLGILSKTQIIVNVEEACYLTFLAIHP